MNTHTIVALIKARLVEAHKLAHLRDQLPACEPRIEATKASLADIDAKLNVETREGRAAR